MESTLTPLPSCPKDGGHLSYVVRNNKAEYVVLSMAAYEDMLADLAESRLTASEADLKAGRVLRGSADELLREAKQDEKDPA